MSEVDSALAASTYMLDTNVFNDIADGRVPASFFAGLRLTVIGVQLDELRASKPQRAADLLKVAAELDVATLLASSFLFGIEGAGWDQSEWNDGTGRFDAMLTRLRALDGRDRGPNQIRDVSIAETALKRGVVLVTGDKSLRALVIEFGGTAINPHEIAVIRSGSTPAPETPH